MTRLEKLQQDVNDEICKLRRLHFFMEQEDFQEAWNKAYKEAKDPAEELIKKRNLDELKLWLLLNYASDLEELSLYSLRKIAKARSIKHWSRLSRGSLIQEIKDESKKRYA